MVGKKESEQIKAVATSPLLAAKALLWKHSVSLQASAHTHSVTSGGAGCSPASCLLSEAFPNSGSFLWWVSRRGGGVGGVSAHTESPLVTFRPPRAETFIQRKYETSASSHLTDCTCKRPAAGSSGVTETSVAPQQENCTAVVVLGKL